jgi:hypothetical protein
MGQKVNPYGFRLGVTTDWKSRWFSDREYKDYLIEDWQIRDDIMKQLPHAAISRIEVERTRDKLGWTSTPPVPASSSAAGGARPTACAGASPRSPATTRSS